MIVHPFRASEFLVSDFSPQRKKGAYLETSHRELLLSETQRELKLRARHIAATATRLLREQTGEKSVLAETEIVRVVELIGQSLENGLNPPTPLARESLVWFTGLIGASPKRAQRWIQMVRLSIDAAETELAFQNYLTYANQAEILLGHIRRLTPALQFEAAIATAAHEIAAKFLSACDASDSIGQDEDSILQEILGQFLRNFGQLLKVGSEAELLLNLGRFWVEQLAARYECSSREWLFLCSAIEQALVSAIGLADARALCRYFLVLEGAIPRFTFAGILARNSAVLSEKLKDFTSDKTIDRHRYIQMATAEMLLATSTQIVPPSRQLLLAGEGPLQAASHAQFQTFSAQLIRACRPLVERSWLDWLEVELQSTGEILRGREEREAAAPLFQKTLEQTCQNLRQGLNVLQTHTHLAADLQLLLDEAQQSVLLFAGDLARARPYFRRRLILTFGLGASESIWRHGHVMVSALLTSIRRNNAFAPYWNRYGGVLDLLGEMKSLLAESEFVVAAWPHLSAIVPDFSSIGTKVEKGLAQGALATEPARVLAEQRLALLCQFLREFLLVGATTAVPLTLQWFLHNSAPLLAAVPPHDICDAWREVVARLDQHEPFAGSAFAQSCRALGEELTPTLLSTRLWLQSDAIARETSINVFAGRPDYLEQTGNQGVGKCARDNALTLRRVALAFAPGISDPGEFVETWWNELVNSYVVHRPERLFVLNEQELVAACQRQLDATAADMVDRLLRPILGLGDGEETASALGVFSPLAAKPLLADWARPSHDFDVEAFLREFGPNAGLTNHLNFLTDGLVASFDPFEWSGTVDAACYTLWRELFAAGKIGADEAGRFLFSLLTQTESIPTLLPRLRVGHYFQAQMAVVRQVAAAGELKIAALKLSKGISASPEHQAEDKKRPDQPLSRPELPHLLLALAEVLGSCPEGLAWLELPDCAISASSQNSGTEDNQLWSSLWHQAGKASHDLLSPAADRELEVWWKRLERMGPGIPLVEAIHRKLLASEQAVFSLDPDEETVWRDLLGTVLSLSNLSEAAPGLAAAARLQVVLHHPLVQTIQVADHLDQLLKLIRTGFVNLDLKPIQREIESIKALVGVVRRLEEIAGSAPTVAARLVALIPALAPLAASLDTFLIRLARFALLPQAAGRSAGALSPLLQGLTEPLAQNLQNLSPRDRDQFRAVLANSDPGGDEWANAWSNLQAILQERPQFEELGQDLIKSAASMPFAAERREQLLWAARRYLTLAWSRAEVRPEEENVAPVLSPEWAAELSSIPAYFHRDDPLSHRARRLAEAFVQRAIHPHA